MTTPTRTAVQATPKSLVALLDPAMLKWGAAPDPTRNRPDRKRKASGRARKAENEKRRDAFVVRRFGVYMRRGLTRQDAAAEVAWEINDGRHLPNWRLRIDRLNADRGTYTTSSVLRLLRRIEKLA